MDPTIERDSTEETFWAHETSSAGQTANLGGPGGLLAEQLDTMHRWPTWAEASELGVELVDHPDTAAGIFHLASGDIVYPTDAGWEVLHDARSGAPILSGTMRRIHNPEISPDARIHPTAQVDPTARVEAGAIIAPHAVVGADAHIGRDAYIGRQTFVGAGAFVGTQATVRAGCHLGEGAVVGTRADLGSCTRVGAGAQIAPQAVVDAHRGVAGGDTVANVRRRSLNPWQAGQLASTIERLASMNRE